ncbi:MAG: glycosyltransferase [Actinomycetota bacterium]|nr:glycosyltransferase [Actinomycetota bacterium]
MPQEGPDFDSWAPGRWNFYFEVWQTAIERLGADRVSFLDVARGESWESWVPRLVALAHETEATHIITHIESDPGSESSTWHWDVAWAELLRSWDGVLLGVMFDSAYFWIRAQSRRLARMSPRFVVVDICMPMDGSMRRGRPEVGPVNMPVCATSLELVRDRCSSIQKMWDVSFIGVLYPYRVDALEELRRRGVKVAVNPHRNDNATDYRSTKVDQPAWLDYMAALAASRLTINFSQSNAGPVQQLKTRVIEGMLAGTVVVTDDVDRTSRFFSPGVDYRYFRDLDALPDVISQALAEPGILAESAAAVRPRAESLANRGFWDAIDVGLRRRSLPSVLSH